MVHYRKNAHVRQRLKQTKVDIDLSILNLSLISKLAHYVQNSSCHLTIQYFCRILMSLLHCSDECTTQVNATRCPSPTV